MSEQHIKLIRTVYGILTSILLVAVGICLILSCIGIYQSGDRPFSRESVGEAFSRIAVVVYITIGAVVMGLIGDLFLKKEERTEKGKIAPKVTLSHLYPRLDTEKASPAGISLIEKVKKQRLIAKIAAAVLCVACAIPVLIHLFTPGNFTMENLNGDIFASIWLLCGFSALAFAVCVAYSIWERYTYEKEIALVKKEMADGAVKKADIALPKEGKNEKTYIAVVRIIIAVLALVFIIVGIFNGGMADVLAKAVRICTECIGLG